MKKNYLVEFNISLKNALYGLQKILLDNNKRTELVFVAVEGRKTYSPERFEGSVRLGLPF